MRSKPDQVDQPERTALRIVQTNITVQMRPSGGYGVRQSISPLNVQKIFSCTLQQHVTNYLVANDFPYTPVH